MLPLRLWALLGWAAAGLVLAGCGTQEVIFQNKAHKAAFKAARRAEPDTAILAYRPDSSLRARYVFVLGVNDVVALRFFNLDEEAVRSLALTFDTGTPQGQGQGQAAQAAVSLTVDARGEITFPLIGRLQVEGLTLLALRERLETEYRKFYKDIYLNVTSPSMRVFVFGEVLRPGVVVLPQEQTRLTEVLSLAGGLRPGTARTDRVAILRDQGTAREQVIWVDLRKLTHTSDLALIVRHNDHIYVEPRIATRVLRDVQPFTIIVSFLAIVNTLLLLRSVL